MHPKESPLDQALLAYSMGDFEHMPGMNVLAPMDDMRRELTELLRKKYPNHSVGAIETDVEEAMQLWATDHTGQYIHQQALSHSLTALRNVAEAQGTVRELLAMTGKALRKRFISKFVSEKVEGRGKPVE